MFINIPFAGPAFRAKSGFRHAKRTTAGDVIRHEQSELGNRLGFSNDEIRELDEFPAESLVWVCRTAEEAGRYGDNVVRVNLPYGAMAISFDKDGGILVFRGRIDAMKGEDGNDSISNGSVYPMACLVNPESR